MKKSPNLNRRQSRTIITLKQMTTLKVLSNNLYLPVNTSRQDWTPKNPTRKQSSRRQAEINTYRIRKTKRKAFLLHPCGNTKHLLHPLPSPDDMRPLILPGKLNVRSRTRCSCNPSKANVLSSDP